MLSGYKYQVHLSSKFKRNLKKIQKRGYDIEMLYDVIRNLANDIPLAPKYRDHQLSGDKKRFRECHISPYWLLIYEKTDNKLILYLYATGTHADLLE